MDERLQQSLGPGGGHAMLAALVGEWEGTTRTWFEPDVLADESAWRGTIRSVLGGRFVVHEYEGAMGGEPLEGIAIHGFDLDTGRFLTAWIDSFHNGTTIMRSEGERTPAGFSVLGSFTVPDSAPWGWRTEIALVDADHVVITMYNITPEGSESKGVETRYTRRVPAPTPQPAAAR
jgi:hypothetical protein